MCAISALRDSASRASRLARTTLKTEIRVDLVLTIALSDSAYRALALTGTARQTCIRNYICHIVILLILVYDFIKHYFFLFVN